MVKVLLVRGISQGHGQGSHVTGKSQGHGQVLLVRGKSQGSLG